MKLLSWLFGSMSLASLLAGVLLLLHPNPTQAGQTVPCPNCTYMCTFITSQSLCNGKNGCPGGGACDSSCECSNWNINQCQCQ